MKNENRKPEKYIRACEVGAGIYFTEISCYSQFSKEHVLEAATKTLVTANDKGFKAHDIRFIDKSDGALITAINYDIVKPVFDEKYNDKQKQCAEDMLDGALSLESTVFYDTLESHGFQGKKLEKLVKTGAGIFLDIEGDNVKDLLNMVFTTIYRFNYIDYKLVFARSILLTSEDGRETNGIILVFDEK